MSETETTTRLDWTRIPGPRGDYCQGYQAKGIDGLRIMRHHVDDRESGGHVHTFWDLYIDGAPVDQFPSLASAKQQACRA